MIKAILAVEGSDMRTLVLGISAVNIARLLQGKPIIVRGVEVGIPIDVMVIAEITDEELVETIQNIGEMPDRKNVHPQPKDDNQP